MNTPAETTELFHKAIVYLKKKGVTQREMVDILGDKAIEKSTMSLFASGQYGGRRAKPEWLKSLFDEYEFSESDITVDEKTKIPDADSLLMETLLSIRAEVAGNRQVLEELYIKNSGVDPLAARKTLATVYKEAIERVKDEFR